MILEKTCSSAVWAIARNSSIVALFDFVALVARKIVTTPRVSVTRDDRVVAVVGRRTNMSPCNQRPICFSSFFAWMSVVKVGVSLVFFVAAGLLLRQMRIVALWRKQRIRHGALLSEAEFTAIGLPARNLLHCRKASCSA